MGVPFFGSSQTSGNSAAEAGMASGTPRKAPTSSSAPETLIFPKPFNKEDFLNQLGILIMVTEQNLTIGFWKDLGMWGLCIRGYNMGPYVMVKTSEVSSWTSLMFGKNHFSTTYIYSTAQARGGAPSHYAAAVRRYSCLQ